MYNATEQCSSTQQNDIFTEIGMKITQYVRTAGRALCCNVYRAPRFGEPDARHTFGVLGDRMEDAKYTIRNGIITEISVPTLPTLVKRKSNKSERGDIIYKRSSTAPSTASDFREVCIISRRGSEVKQQAFDWEYHRPAEIEATQHVKSEAAESPEEASCATSMAVESEKCITSVRPLAELSAATLAVANTSEAEAETTLSGEPEDGNSLHDRSVEQGETKKTKSSAAEESAAPDALPAVLAADSSEAEAARTLDDQSVAVPPEKSRVHNEQKFPNESDEVTI